jgi:hypothetical protein
LTDEITQDGERTRVVTRVDIRVKLLGITLHRVRAEWEETWLAGALQQFNATTTRNGSSESVTGRHEDGKFIVQAGEREFDAPAEIQPANPWSLQFVQAVFFMSPESGEVFPANVKDKGFETIGIGGQSRRVRHYILQTDTTSHLYFDEAGTLLQVEFRDITGSVRFTLRSGEEPLVASAR